MPTPRTRLLTWLLALLLVSAALIGVAERPAGASNGSGARQQDPTPDTAATIAALQQLQLQMLATQTAEALLTATPTATPRATNTPRPAATRRPTLTPRPTQRAEPALVEVLVGGVNLRSGPGGSFAVIGSASAGQQLPVTGQSGNCAWLQIVLEDGSEAWITGAAAYTALRNVRCSALTAAGAGSANTGSDGGGDPLPTATNAPQAAQPTARPTTPPAAVAPAAPPAPGVITSFEPFGTWRRGDQPYGTLTQSTAEVAGGSASAALDYDFPAAAGSDNYVVFLAQSNLRIPPGAENITIQVFGDGSGHFLNLWVRDAAAKTWQLTFGRINHTGWATMSLTPVASTEWPNGPIDGSGDTLVEPLTVAALVLDGAPDGQASRGTIYLDDLATGAGAATSGAAANSSAATNTTADTGTAAPVAETAAVAAAPAPSGPLAGRIAYARFNPTTNTMDTLIYDLAAGQVTHNFPGRRQPDLAGNSLLVNAETDSSVIYRMISLGGEQIPTTVHVEDAFPQWSPSMESMIYATTSNGDRRARLHYQVDVSAQTESPPMRVLSSELFGDYPVYLDNWRVAYQGCNSWSGGSRCGIYTADSRGSEPNRVTDETSDLPSGNLGSEILFSARRSGNWDVWIVNFDGANLRQLTTDAAIDGLATASPDRSTIAFVSNRDGTWAVWAMNVDGGNQRKLFDLGGGYGPGDFDWVRERISWGP
jgi:hypothetical protein